MPRKPNENREKAKQLYEHGGRTVKEIADKLGIPLPTVKNWKRRDKWRTSEKKANPKQPGEKIQKDSKKIQKDSKRIQKDSKKIQKDSKGIQKDSKRIQRDSLGGAPVGNMNAVGHGAPKGSTNALKHGAYSLAKMGVFGDEELHVVEGDLDLETHLIEEIRFYTIRERRIMKAINHFTEQTDSEGNTGLDAMYTDQSIETVDKRSFSNEEEAEKYKEEIKERVERGERLPGEKGQQQETKSNVANMILRFEKELSTVQRAKAATIKELAEYQVEHGDKAKTEADDWADIVGDIEAEEKDG